MNNQENNRLLSEQTALKRMLETIPVENLLDRSGLEGRLEEVGEQLKYNERIPRARNVGEVCQTAAGLGQDNFREEETTLHGEFQGVLPNAGEFEFKLLVNGDVILGTIGPAIADPHVINQHMHRPTTISVRATQVGDGNTRYMLLALPSWE